MQLSEIIKHVRHIEIRSKRLVNELFSGEYHSIFKGRGMEFQEVREYQPGDDIRLIDWNVTARQGVPFVKKFREERELVVMLVVDHSRSGEFGTRQQFKNELAAEICAVLAFAAIFNNDKVGMILFTDEVERYIPPKKGTSHVLRLVREALSFEPRRSGTSLTTTLQFLNRVQKRKSVVFLISDFFDRDYQKALTISGRRHDLIAIRIIDPREQLVPPVGLVELEDAETGLRVVVDTGDPNVLESFRRRAADHERRVAEAFKKSRTDRIAIQTGKSYIEPLVAFFRQRERRFR